MAKRKEEAVEVAKREGFHWWDREFFLTEMAKFLERLKADTTLYPCCREQDDGGLYFFTSTAGKAVNGDGDGGFDNSHFCPPFCLPGQP